MRAIKNYGVLLEWYGGFNWLMRLYYLACEPASHENVLGSPICTDMRLDSSHYIALCFFLVMICSLVKIKRLHLTSLRKLRYP